MLKNIMIVLVLVIGLQAMPVGFLSQAPVTYAANPEPGETIDDPSFMFDLSAITHEGITGTTRQSWIRQGINYFFEKIIGFLAAVIGSLAVLMLSVGGFMMLASGGDENMYNKGKGFAKNSLIGLTITLLAYILVALVQLLITSIYG
ncbi:MAG: hypothetical protein V1880_02035 [Patescibacteria group bacterium]